MRSIIAAFIIISAAIAAQSPAGLGDDPSKFDELLDTAFAGRDTVFLETVAAVDMRFTNGATVWNKQQFVEAARAATGSTRTVDAVQVERHGDLVETVGHLRVATAGPPRSESQIYFVRLYRRGPNGWLLVSHRTVREVDGPLRASTPAAAVQQNVPGDADTTTAGAGVPPEAGVSRPGNGVTYPRVLHEAKPQYTSDAMQKRIQGRVMLECVVNADGSVGNVKVVRSLDAVYGLDEEAIKAAKQWRFEPATRNGQPVPVSISVEMTFTLGK